MNADDRTVRDLRVLASIACVIAIAAVAATAVAIRTAGPIAYALSPAMSTLAVLLLWFVVRGGNAVTCARMRVVWRWALWSAGAGFIAGGVAPILFVVDANMAPVFGLFFTAPPGFVVGAAIGWVRSRSDRGLPCGSGEPRR